MAYYTNAHLSNSLIRNTLTLNWLTNIQLLHCRGFCLQFDVKAKANQWRKIRNTRSVPYLQRKRGER